MLDLKAELTAAQKKIKQFQDHHHYQKLEQLTLEHTELQNERERLLALNKQQEKEIMKLLQERKEWRAKIHKYHLFVQKLRKKTNMLRRLNREYADILEQNPLSQAQTRFNQQTEIPSDSSEQLQIELRVYSAALEYTLDNIQRLESAISDLQREAQQLRKLAVKEMHDD
ncbi:hypothetical protein [Bacillus xiapuensis]|uniref:hypothetical protein n=1 Tax=Bacillus xiapuensis TaxID=2014075 RepID=UPI000C2436D0|nr:hypothetical protein [Bacillus xiapuensis]